jgi:hypothetical protein
VTRAEFTQLRKELARFRVMVKANAAAIEVLRRDCATNLRRCGELQRDIDALKKIWG